MTLKTNNAHSRNIQFDVTRVARIVAVGFSILITRSADAGLIENPKEANTKQSSTKGTLPITSCQQPFGVSEAGAFLTVSSDIPHLCSTLNADQTQHNSVLNPSIVTPSNERRIISEDASGILSLKYNGLSIDESLVYGHDDHSIYVNHDSNTRDNISSEPSATYIPGRETILIDTKQAQGISSARHHFSGRESQDTAPSDQQESDGESSGEDSMEDLQAVSFQPLVHMDSFDPLAATVAFLILSGIAIAVNLVPCRTGLTA